MRSLINACVRANRFEYILILLYSTLLRVFFIQGYGLGDDSPYLDLISYIAQGAYPEIGDVGQYPYRPGWLLPLGLSVAVFGYSDLSLVAYPFLCGLLTPLLLYHWIRSLPENPYPQIALIASIVYASFPLTIFHSTVLSNDTPMFFWILLSTIFFSKVLNSTISAGSNKFIFVLLTVVASISAIFAYQVKVSAIPSIAVYYLLQTLVIFKANKNRFFSFDVLRRSLLFVFIYGLPFVGVQLFYLKKTGHFFGNILGEMKLYELWIPKHYYTGELSNLQILNIYPHALFFQSGFSGYQYLISSIYIWICCFITALFFAALVGRILRNMSSTKLRLSFAKASVGMTMMFFLAAVVLYLFFQYWPAKLTPFYLTNNFTGRSERYIIPLLPLILIFSCLAYFWLLMILPNLWMRVFRILVVALVCIATVIAGYSITVKDFFLRDKRVDMKLLAHYIMENETPCHGKVLIIDVDGRNHLKFEMGWKDPFQFLHFFGSDLSIHQPEGCLVTGGSRREGVTHPYPVDIGQFEEDYHFERIFEAPLRKYIWRTTPVTLWHFKRRG